MSIRSDHKALLNTDTTTEFFISSHSYYLCVNWPFFGRSIKSSVVVVAVVVVVVVTVFHSSRVHTRFYTDKRSDNKQHHKHVVTEISWDVRCFY